MKPAPLSLLRPRDVGEAVAALAEHGGSAKVLAGGQSLVPLLSMRLVSPAVLVDVNGLASLDYLRCDSTGVSIGALARARVVERCDAAFAVQPLLRQALRLVAHPAIRNRGTVVGSLAHADPAAELPAVAALLGGTVTCVSVHGRREVPAAEFVLGPMQSALEPGELAASLWLPVLPPGAGTAIEEVSRRHGDYALCGVAALVERDLLGAVTAARAVYFAVGDTPLVLDLTAALAGDTGPDGLACAADTAMAAVTPESDIHASADYRRHLAGVLTRRALTAALTAAAATRIAPEAAARSAVHTAAEAAARSAVHTAAEAAPESARPAPALPNERHFRPTMLDESAVRSGGRSGVPVDDEVRVRLRVNGQVRDVQVPARRLLSDALRRDAGLVGTHVGCEHGVCGACTVLLDGEPVRSCLLLAAGMEGHEITTVEGLTPDGEPLRPVQQAFTDCHGLQCGFCTAGFLTTVTAGLRENPTPTRDEAREMVAGNLCRCTGYQNIVASVLRAAELTGRS